jgi:general secretion pathway protein A
MYKDFYELTRTPFDITPDPSSFFPSPGHNEALANLSYGVIWRKGFTVLTGEVGTGKTLLVSCLLDLLKSVQVAFGYIVNTRLTPGEFLRYMVHDLQVPTQARDKSELLLDFSKYLIERHRRGSTTALVVDEAHALELDVLEEIRFLGNLETARQKLLQVVLVGQPELDTKLDSPELRQLKQRIMLRCRLQPLHDAETRPYIERRLLAAGAKPDRISFPDPTVELIYLYSNGVPRVINTICENALVVACAQRLRVIIPSIIEEVAADFHLKRTMGIPANAECRTELFGGPEAVNRTSAFIVNP